MRCRRICEVQSYRFRYTRGASERCGDRVCSSVVTPSSDCLREARGPRLAATANGDPSSSCPRSGPLGIPPSRTLIVRFPKQRCGPTPDYPGGVSYLKIGMGGDQKVLLHRPSRQPKFSAHQYELSWSKRSGSSVRFLSRAAGSRRVLFNRGSKFRSRLCKLAHLGEPSGKFIGVGEYGQETGNPVRSSPLLPRLAAPPPR